MTNESNGLCQRGQSLMVFCNNHLFDNIAFHVISVSRLMIFIIYFLRLELHLKRIWRGGGIIHLPIQSLMPFFRHLLAMRFLHDF